MALKDVFKTVPVNIRDLVIDALDQEALQEEDKEENTDEEQIEKKSSSTEDPIYDLIYRFEKIYAGARWGIRMYYKHHFLSEGKKFTKYKSKSQVLLAEVLLGYMKAYPDNCTPGKTAKFLSTDCMTQCSPQAEGLGTYMWKYILKLTNSVNQAHKLLVRTISPVHFLQDSSGRKLRIEDDGESSAHSCKSSLHQLHFFSFMFGANSKVPFAPHLAWTLMAFLRELLPDLNLEYLKARR